MKAINIILVSFLFVSTYFSQQDLLPIFPREITYKGERAFFNSAPFSGLLVDEKTNVKWGEFRNGYKIGLFTEFYSNGKKKSEGNYLNGSKIGLHTEWYENGNKMKECNYENGILNGIFSEWFSNGQIKFEYFFSSGKIRDGNYTNYNENGQKKIQEYYVNGQKSGEGIYKGDDLYNKTVEYYPQGEKKAEGSTKNGIKDGIWTELFKTGEKKKVIEYCDGNIAKVIYENKFDPALSIKLNRKLGSDLYRIINKVKNDTSYIMVIMNFDIRSSSNVIISDITARFQNEFSICLQGMLYKMTEAEISNNLNKTLAYSIEFSRLSYEIKRFNAGSAFPGEYNYTGEINIDMNIKNIISDRSVFTSTLSASKAYTYPLYKSDLQVLLSLPSELCGQIRANIYKQSFNTSNYIEDERENIKVEYVGDLKDEKKDGVGKQSYEDEKSEDNMTYNPRLDFIGNYRNKSYSGEYKNHLNTLYYKSDCTLLEFSINGPTQDSQAGNLKIIENTSLITWITIRGFKRNNNAYEYMSSVYLTTETGEVLGKKENIERMNKNDPCITDFVYQIPSLSGKESSKVLYINFLITDKFSTSFIQGFYKLNLIK